MRLTLLLIVMVLNYSVNAEKNNYGLSKEKVNQSEINWLLDRQNIQEFRGGTTDGLDPDIDLNTSDYFQKLQSATNKKDKDRIAILAMAGDHKANFEFTEIFGSNPNYKLDNPYKSWGTETIIVIQNSENFISLQHILVMFMKDENGKINGPYIQKHWRQDWSYEDRKILEFQGENVWNVKKYKNVKNTWSQAVYQVDDSPRYESYGAWIHEEGASRWISKMTNRPLPRREHSVRNDYDLLKGVNKISILPWGWVMEENNDKIKTSNKYIGTEYGLARYQKVVNYDFTPAFKYWQSSKGYWDLVRDRWDRIISYDASFCMKKHHNDKPLFNYHFSQAEKYTKEKDILKAKRDVDQTINNFIINDCDGNKAEAKIKPKY
jgi:hypothetical protein